MNTATCPRSTLSHLEIPTNPNTATGNRVERELGTLSSEIRRLSHQPHPAVLEDLGLRIALVRLAEDFQNSGER